jgi:hypothetical protein
LGKFYKEGRRRFKGVFVRFGEKTGYKGKRATTVLLKEVVCFDSENCVADHLWFTMGKQFERLELKKEDVVAFDARVTIYEKGFRGNGFKENGKKQSLGCIDYRLSYPTAFVKIAKSEKSSDYKTRGHELQR